MTSNPTPAYIYRVSEVFRDNGQGVRGDLKAVVRAILTDYEARTTDLLGNEGYGRLKEPILRLSQVIRASHPFSNGAAKQIPARQFSLAFIGATHVAFSLLCFHKTSDARHFCVANWGDAATRYTNPRARLVTSVVLE